VRYALVKIRWCDHLSQDPLIKADEGRLLVATQVLRNCPSLDLGHPPSCSVGKDSLNVWLKGCREYDKFANFNATAQDPARPDIGVQYKYTLCARKAKLYKKSNCVIEKYWNRDLTSYNLGKMGSGVPFGVKMGISSTK
jgi:hypothetical protein